MSERIRILVADDHPLFRDGVVASLNAADDLEVVAEVGDAEAALRGAQQYVPDVALLDITMPQSGGIRAAHDITAAAPSTRIIMLTASEDEDDLLAAMKAGAKGYVLKGVGASELRDVIRRVNAGEVYVAPRIAFGLLRELSKPRAVDPLEELTAREREVLELLATGLGNKEIADRLSVAERTIKHHMTNILAKLQVSSRVEAALLAQRSGMGARPEA